MLCNQCATKGQAISTQKACRKVAHSGNLSYAYFIAKLQLWNFHQNLKLSQNLRNRDELSQRNKIDFFKQSNEYSERAQILALPGSFSKAQYVVTPPNYIL